LHSFRGAKVILTQEFAETILNTLKENLIIPNMVKINKDPYETLILTIISQNTADINTERIFKKLSERYKLSPQTLANTRLSEIEDCLRVGGLYRRKARTIQVTSKIINEKYQGTLRNILSLPLEAARKTLMGMPGVGPKTADVVLLFSAKKPVIPVDTHVNRVSKRLGLASPKGGYEAVRLSLESMFDPKDYLAVHLLLIAHGRKYCKARLSRCQKCPLSNYCQSHTLAEKK
jgi:endonuclease III